MSLSRLIVLGIGGLLIVTTALASAAVQAQERQGNVVCRGVQHPAGLTMDNRCNMYTADRKSGHVFCIPPSENAILLGTVPGTPTSVAVDRLRNVFVGTETGHIFLVALDGSVVEAYRCTSTPVGLDVDRDGGLLVATRDGEIVKVKRSDFF